MWDYDEEHFIRYVNLEYWKDNYEEILKTGFEFPKIFISCIKHIMMSIMKKEINY